MSGVFCSLALIADLLAGCAPPPLATGYVEGEFVLVAPAATARIEDLAVKRGDRVAAGDVLAVQERRDAEIALAQAEAALARARSERANLLEDTRICAEAPEPTPTTTSSTTITGAGRSSPERLYQAPTGSWRLQRARRCSATAKTRTTRSAAIRP